MADVMRCPYCVQDGTFRPMKTRSEGHSFRCEVCGHTVMQCKPDFECQCDKCKALSRSLKTQILHPGTNDGRNL